MTHKEAYIELKTRLEKAEYELRLMRQEQADGSSEQKRLDDKISGLMISLEYIHEIKELIEDAITSGWNKLDPGHMPPDGKPILATVLLGDGEKHVRADLWKNEEYEWLKQYITHWMPYPTPAQD